MKQGNNVLYLKCFILAAPLACRGAAAGQNDTDIFLLPKQAGENRNETED